MGSTFPTVMVDPTPSLDASPPESVEEEKTDAARLAFATSRHSYFTFWALSCRIWVA